MKVALLNDQLNAGGAEKVLVNMANIMHDEGVEVIVVLFMSPSALDKQLHTSIPVYYLKRTGRFDRVAMKKLKQLVKDCQVVHVHSRYNLRYYMVAKFLAGIHGPKIVFHEHVPAYEKVDGFTRILFKSVDGYIGVLQKICDWATKQKMVNPTKVFYLPNIVATPSAPINFSNHTIRKILMVANFRRVKNHLFAIQLIEQLDDATTLDLYGMVEEQEYYNEVKAYIQSHNLADRVKIIIGVNNMYDVLGNYNAAIHTATSETGPLVLLEYMHAGLPFVTYNTGDVAANISGDLPELIIPSFNKQEWIDKLKSLMVDEKMRNNLCQRMTQVVQQNYTPEKYWQRLSDVYKTVLQ